MAFDVGRAIAYLDLDITAFNSAIDSANSAFNRLGGEPIGLFGTLDTALTKIQDVGTAMTNLGSQLTTNLSLPILNFGIDSLNTSRSFETAFTGVKKTVDATDEQFEKLEQSIRNMSTSTASTYEEISDVMQVAGQLGVPTESLEEFTRIMIMMGDATDLTAQQAALNLARVMNITGTSFDEVGNLGSAIVDLGNKFATQEPEIVLMTNRLASAGTMAGLTVPDILALSTAMSSVGIRAEAGGTAMSTTLAQITKFVANLRSENEDTASEAIEAIELIAKISGVSSQEFVESWGTDPITAIYKFIKGLGEMDDGAEGTILALDTLGMSGIRQSNMLRSLSLASETLGSAINVSNQAWDENVALSNEAETRYGTLDSRISMLNERWRQMKDDIGQILIPVLEKLMDLAESLITAWNGLSEEQKENIVNWAMMAAAIGPVLMVIGKVLTAIGTIGKVISTPIQLVGKLVGAFKQFEGVHGIIGKITEAIGSGSAEGGGTGLLGKLGGIAMVIGGAVTAVKSFFDMWNEGFSWLKEILMVIGIAIAAVGAVILGVPAGIAAIVAAVVAAVATAAVVIHEHWDEIKEFFANLIEGIKEKWQAFKDWLGELWSNVKEWFGEKWEGVKEFFGDLVEGIKEKWNAFTEWLGGIWDRIKEFWGTKWESLKTWVGEKVEGLKEKWEQFKEFVGAIWDKIKEYWRDKLESLKQWVGEKVDAIKQVWEQFKEFVGGIWELIVEKWNATWEMISGFIATVWNAIVDFFSDTWNKIVTFFSDVWNNFTEWVGNIWNKLTGFFSDVWNKITGFFGDIWNKVTEFFGNIWEKLVSWLKDNYEEITGFFSNIFKKFIEWIKEIWDKFVGWIKDIWDKVVEFLGDLWDKTIGWLWDLIKKFVEWIKESIEKFVQFFKDLVEKFREGFDNIVKKIRDFGHNFFEAGKHLFSMLWDGIKDIWNGIVGWIEDKFGWIIEKFQWIAEKIDSVIPGFSSGNMFGLDGSHRSGLDYVPFDGYIAELHQGERVLTKQEAREYNENISGSGGDVYNFYNTRPDPYEYSRQMKRVKRELKMS